MRICIDLLSAKNSDRIFGLNLCLFSTHFQFPFFLSPGNLQDGVSLSQVQIGGRLAYFYKILHYFSVFLQYFSMFVNIFQYFIEKTGSLRSANWREDHPLFSRLYSSFQYFTVFFIIVQYFLVFSNIVQYLQYFSVYLKKDSVSQLQIGGRLAPFLQETLSREGL